MSFFAPVPEEYAAGYGVVESYEGHVVGAGPYRLATYIPGETVVLDRSPNWDPATGPCARPGWTGSGQFRPPPAGDPAGDRRWEGRPLAHQPRAPDKVAALGPTPSGPGGSRSSRRNASTWSSGPTRAPAPADVRVRQAVNYAIDKAAYRDAVAAPFAPAGELPLHSSSPRPRSAITPTTCTRPRVAGVTRAKAKALLAWPATQEGLTLSFVTFGSGRLAAGNKAIKDSLARAGIRLKVKNFKPDELHEKSLAIPVKRLEHQLGHSGWSNGWPGDNARDTIEPQFDSRLGDVIGGNFSEYHNPDVNRMIDRALAEPDPGPPGRPVGQDRPADHARRPRRPAPSGSLFVPVGP